MDNILCILGYLLTGAFILGIFRATPWGRDPTPGDTPDAVVVIFWPLYILAFLFWILFLFSPHCVTVFCQWLVRDDRKPKPSPTLTEDEVQKVLLGELTKKKKS